jgi:hypothetical protein
MAIRIREEYCQTIEMKDLASRSEEPVEPFLEAQRLMNLEGRLIQRLEGLGQLALGGVSP